jgi:hypothetical protein
MGPACIPLLLLRFWDTAGGGIPKNGAGQERPLRYGDASSNLCLNDTMSSTGGYLTLDWCAVSDANFPPTWWGSSGNTGFYTVTSSATAGPIKAASEGQNGNYFLCDTLVSNCGTATGKATNWWIGSYP